MTALPKPVQPFVDFSQILRAHGFAIAPEQTTAFIEAIGVLGPGNMMDIYRAGLAMLAIQKDRQAEYDALFRAFFMGRTVSAPVISDDDDEGVEAHEEQDGSQEVEVVEDDQDVGAEASVMEAHSRRQFSTTDEMEALRQFRRQAPTAIPRRRSYRYTSARHGATFDMGRSLREAVRRDGEILELKERRRKTRQRPIVLLIDVSGSMKDQSEQAMRFAHALKMAGDRVEVFTFGTRLTRITRALSDRNVERALSRVGALVADFDGGTRIGDAFDAILSVPRFAGAMRGASVVVLSDGLERGEPGTMVDAVQRMSRIAWRVDWLSPLAGDAEYVPRTEALSAALPHLDSLSDGSRIEAICSHVLSLSKFKKRIAA